MANLKSVTFAMIADSCEVRDVRSSLQGVLLVFRSASHESPPRCASACAQRPVYRCEV